MPSKMETLYRFFQHDDAKTDKEPIWSISSTRYEEKSRLYRILYKDINNNILIDIEKIIPIVNYNQFIEPIFDTLVACMKRTDMVNDFQKACKLLVLEDPWIHEYSRQFISSE